MKTLSTVDAISLLRSCQGGDRRACVRGQREAQLLHHHDAPAGGHGGLFQTAHQPARSDVSLPHVAAVGRPGLVHSRAKLPRPAGGGGGKKQLSAGRLWLNILAHSCDARRVGSAQEGDPAIRQKNKTHMFFFFFYQCFGEDGLEKVGGRHGS